MSKKSDEPNILLDSDVVIHFVKGGQQLLLPKIFPGRFVMLDKVHKELTVRNSATLLINNFLVWCKIPVIAMPTDRMILAEYAKLKQTLGEGEAACLAVARFKKEYVASSNLHDIYNYCQEHKIVYYTTMDLLLELYNTEILTEAECDEFIYNVKSKGSKLINGIDTIENYKKMKK
ncbi:MAG: hypothetical protein KF900_11505 [Bacteroidetes bacterium]|nr:hypothetical protein [Bacteroidota bacterium]